MSTPDTNNIGIKLQAAGENLNTWGDPNLNNDLIVLSNMGSKWNPITINGDTTISETNYSTSNDTEVAVIDLVAGTVAAAFNLVFPSRDKRLLIRNSSGYAATCKLSATAGFALPTGRTAWIATDGSTDMVLMSANFGGITSPTSGSRDIPAWSAVETAIATAGLPASAGTVLVSGTDTTAGYAAAKITALTNGGLVGSTLNSGANEQRQFGLDFTNLTVTTNVAATDRFGVYDATAGAMRYQTRALAVGKFGLVNQASSATVNPVVAGNLYPVDCTSGAGAVTFPASASVGDVFGLIKFGTNAMTVNTNSLNYYGVAYAAFGVSDEGISLFYYTGASRGWIDL